MGCAGGTRRTAPHLWVMGCAGGTGGLLLSGLGCAGHTGRLLLTSGLCRGYTGAVHPTEVQPQGSLQEQVKQRLPVLLKLRQLRIHHIFFSWCNEHCCCAFDLVRTRLDIWSRSFDMLLTECGRGFRFFSFILTRRRRRWEKEGA